MGTILGPIFGPDRPKRGQDEPKRAIKSFKDQKSYIFKKVVFALDCLHFFALEASQESLKRPKMAPKKQPESSKIPNKRDPKSDKKIVQKMTPKITKK